MVLHHFSVAIIIGLLFFCSFPLNAEPAGWLNYACLFVGFITEADVSAGIMEDFRVLLCCWIFFPPLVLSGWRDDEHFGVFRLNMNEHLQTPLRVFDYSSQIYQAVVKGSGMGLLLCCQYESSLISVFLLSISLCYIGPEFSAIMLFHSEFNICIVVLISLHQHII